MRCRAADADDVQGYRTALRERYGDSTGLPNGMWNSACLKACQSAMKQHDGRLAREYQKKGD